MARRSRPCDLLPTLTALLLVAGAAVVVVVADDGDEKCGNPCGNPCGVPCIYASPPPPAEYYPPPPPVYSPPPPEYYPPPPPEYYPPTKPGCSPPPSGGGGGYEPTPETPSGGYNPAPYTPGGGGGWYTPPYLPSYNTPPGTLYPQDPGFKPNAAPGGGATWRAVVAVAAATAVAGALAL